MRKGKVLSQRATLCWVHLQLPWPGPHTPMGCGLDAPHAQVRQGLWFSLTRVSQGEGFMG